MRKEPETKVIKYIQLADAIRRDILDGALKKGDILPSINALAKSEKVARDTVVKAYAELRRRGIIEASHGKGYFVKTDELMTQLSVLLVFDVINAYKEKLFNGIRENLNERIATEVYFHHFNTKYLEAFLQEQKNNFDLFIVMAWSDSKVYSALRQLPENRTILLDRKIQMKEPNLRYVGQDHGGGFLEALYQAEANIKRYKRINLVFRDKHNHPIRIKHAFLEFCRSTAVKGRILKSLSGSSISDEEVYFVIDEEDLVTVVKACRKNGWELGKNVGLVSYNDTPMMEILEGGVSVITTDFYEIGKQLANYLCGGFGDKHEILVPTRFYSRTTL